MTEICYFLGIHKADCEQSFPEFLKRRVVLRLVCSCRIPSHFRGMVDVVKERFMMWRRGWIITFAASFTVPGGMLYIYIFQEILIFSKT